MAKETKAADDTATYEVAVDDVALDLKFKVILLGSIAAVLLLFGGLYLVWALDRVNNDSADRNERA